MASTSRASSPAEYSDSVQQALLAARLAAVRLYHPYVNTEHLLLGLLQQRDPDVQQMWTALQADPDALTRAVEAIVRPGDPKHAISDASGLPYTAVGKRVVAEMWTEAVKVGQLVASPEHLLVALVQEERGIAARVCGELGLTATRARSVVRERPGADARPQLIELDDRADRSIREQIMIQLQERIATGALTPGQRLPPVRNLADQLDIAPGTVAKAYAELERMGVIETHGARGTRVAQRRPTADADAPGELVYQLRPVVLTAFHLGVSARQLRASLEHAMADIFHEGSTSMT